MGTLGFTAQLCLEGPIHNFKAGIDLASSNHLDSITNNQTLSIAGKWCRPWCGRCYRDTDGRCYKECQRPNCDFEQVPLDCSSNGCPRPTTSPIPVISPELVCRKYGLAGGCICIPDNAGVCYQYCFDYSCNASYHGTCPGGLACLL
jgi:hypothetical protein